MCRFLYAPAQSRCGAAQSHWIPLVAPLYASAPLPPLTLGSYEPVISTILPFQKRCLSRIVRHVTFQDWLLFTCAILWRVIQVAASINSSFLFCCPEEKGSELPDTCGIEAGTCDIQLLLGDTRKGMLFPRERYVPNRIKMGFGETKKF